MSGRELARGSQQAGGRQHKNEQSLGAARTVSSPCARSTPALALHLRCQLAHGRMSTGTRSAPAKHTGDELMMQKLRLNACVDEALQYSSQIRLTQMRCLIASKQIGAPEACPCRRSCHRSASCRGLPAEAAAPLRRSTSGCPARRLRSSRFLGRTRNLPDKRNRSGLGSCNTRCWTTMMHGYSSSALHNERAYLTQAATRSHCQIAPGDPSPLLNPA